MRHRLLSIAGSLAVLAAGALAPAQGPPGGMPPPEVTFVVAEKKAMPVSFEYVGVTEASQVVEVRARVRGFLEKRLFEEGATVKEGDLLYQIDPRSFEADVEVANARVEQAEARLALAEREYNRLDSLRPTGAVAQGDYDKALSEFEEARAALRLARAELDKWKLELGYTKIHAPISGIIGKTNKQAGSLVDAGENSLLANITAVSPIYVSLRVSERDFLSWRLQKESKAIILGDGQEERYQIVLQDGEPFPEYGRRVYESASFDPETGTFEVRAEFANAQGLLKPGQFVRVRVVGWQRPDVVAVPQRSVFQAPTGPFVYVIGDDDTVGFRPVKTGDWSGANWIIDSGVNPGERVLVEGFLKARPGSPVTPVPAPADGAEGGGANAPAAAAGGASGKAS